MHSAKERSLSILFQCIDRRKLTLTLNTILTVILILNLTLLLTLKFKFWEDHVDILPSTHFIICYICITNNFNRKKYIGSTSIDLGTDHTSARCSHY